MKRFVTGTTGRSTSKEYIKVALFDYLCDTPQFEIDGVDASKLVKDIEALKLAFDVDDVISLAYDEGITLPEAARELADELASM